MGRGKPFAGSCYSTVVTRAPLQHSLDCALLSCFPPPSPSPSTSRPSFTPRPQAAHLHPLSLPLNALPRYALPFPFPSPFLFPFPFPFFFPEQPQACRLLRPPLPQQAYLAPPALHSHLFDTLPAHALASHALPCPSLSRSQIYLKRAGYFGLPSPGKPSSRLTWSQIQEIVRSKGQTAIGFAPSKGGPEAMRLAPAVDEVFEVTGSDQIVVISEN